MFLSAYMLERRLVKIELAKGTSVLPKFGASPRAIGERTVLYKIDWLCHNEACVNTKCYHSSHY